MPVYVMGLFKLPESVCEELTKLAKYYPNGSLIDTSFGGNASLGWRAIEYGLELLKKGIIWHIGNGKSVKLWRDPWIPRSYSRRPISAKRNCRLRWVSDLIDRSGSWDTDKISHHFLPMDVEAILNIRLSSRLEEDFIAWHPDRLGRFSVRSAYHLAVALAQVDDGSSSSGNGSSRAWNALWKCNAPQKVKIFAWRAITNSLTTLENKKKRKLEVSDICTICGVESEYVVHALFRCPHARQLWEAMSDDMQLNPLSNIHNGDLKVILDMLEQLQPEDQFIREEANE
ncbi:hypothetical protein OsI_30257 [Oryza sativa Indica Group]|uniref:Reverse transcriptase zinc-binding domain-containing protein n=1 Tax=Oryza sativa subsp. indica TaxID=39946 RepID=B8B9K5_ORYSI|nr:hypothetical protein OsI_30257 [Oryza sativa Indica Group]